jgi:hypothetical protein
LIKGLRRKVGYSVTNKDARHMVMTNAEKQRAYRDRHLGFHGEKSRMQLVLSVRARFQLERIARHKGYSVTALVEELAAEVERGIIDRMTLKERQAYFDAGAVTG